MGEVPDPLDAAIPSFPTPDRADADGGCSIPSC